MADDDPVELAVSDYANSLINAENMQVESAIRALLAQEIGRRFLWRMLQIGKYGTQPYARDPQDTAFQCGELNVGIQIQALIVQADPAGFSKLQQESEEHDRRSRNAVNDYRRTIAESSSGADPGNPSGSSPSA